VSLIVRADGLDGRDPEKVVRATAIKGLSETGLPLLGSIIRGSEARALAVKSGPRSRLAAQRRDPTGPSPGADDVRGPHNRGRSSAPGAPPRA
jgi:hypothetical protein